MTAREWPTLDIRSGAELEPSIQSIILALTSYSNVHQCPPRSLATSHTFHTSTTGMCVLQTTDEVDIGGHYNSTLEQGQCSVLTVLTLPQTAPEPMSNVEQPLVKARGGAHSRALATHRVAHHSGLGTPPIKSTYSVLLQA